MSPDQELKNCNIAKTVLMLCVVVYHCIAVNMRGGWGPLSIPHQSSLLGRIAEWLNFFHIYAFTLISGYIFYHIKIEKKGYDQFGGFLINKIKRLIIPYVFIACIWVVPVYRVFYGSESIIQRFILCENPNQLWFLWMIFWIFVIFWVIAKPVDKHPYIFGLFFIVCFLTSNFLNRIPNFFCIHNSMEYILFFYMGFILRKHGMKKLFKIPALVILLIDAILFIVYVMTTQTDIVVFSWLHKGLGLFLRMYGAVGAFVLLQKFATYLESKQIRWMEKYTMSVYLVHQQFIYISIYIFRNYVNAYVLGIISLDFAIICSLLFAVLMSKTKITRFLVGSK